MKRSMKRTNVILSIGEINRLRFQKGSISLWRPVWPHPKDGKYQIVVRNKIRFSAQSEDNFLKNACLYHPYQSVLLVGEDWRVERSKGKGEKTAFIKYRDGSALQFPMYPDNKMLGRKKWQSGLSLPRWAHRYKIEVEDVQAYRVPHFEKDDLISAGFIPSKDSDMFLLPNQEEEVKQDVLIKTVWDEQFCSKGLYHPTADEKPFAWIIRGKFSSID